MEVRRCCYKSWKNPFVKIIFTIKLFSKSGQCLKILISDMLYVNLQKNYLKATPRLFLLYQNTVNYSEVLNRQAYTQERNDLVNKNLSDRRNAYLMFVKSNTHQVGLNLLSNWLYAITHSIPKNTMSYSKGMFKTFSKIDFLQGGLRAL